MPDSSTTRRSWSSPQVPAVVVERRATESLAASAWSWPCVRVIDFNCSESCPYAEARVFSISPILASTFSRDSLSGLTIESIACWRLPSSSADCWWSLPKDSRASSRKDWLLERRASADRALNDSVRRVWASLSAARSASSSVARARRAISSASSLATWSVASRARSVVAALRDWAMNQPKAAPTATPTMTKRMSIGLQRSRSVVAGKPGPGRGPSLLTPFGLGAERTERDLNVRALEAGAGLEGAAVQAEDFAGEEDGEAALVGRGARGGRRQGAVELEALALNGDDRGALGAGADGAQSQNEVLQALVRPVGRDGVENRAEGELHEVGVELEDELLLDETGGEIADRGDLGEQDVQVGGFGDRLGDLAEQGGVFVEQLEFPDLGGEGDFLGEGGAADRRIAAAREQLGEGDERHERVGQLVAEGQAEVAEEFAPVLFQELVDALDLVGGFLPHRPDAVDFRHGAGLDAVAIGDAGRLRDQLAGVQRLAGDGADLD